MAGKAVSFRNLGPGEVFGEYPAIDRGPRSASVEAHPRCLVATLAGAAFRKLIETEPVVALAMLPQLVTKIRALTTRVYEFSTLAVSNRIQAELLRLATLGAKDGKLDPHLALAQPSWVEVRPYWPRTGSIETPGRTLNIQILLAGLAFDETGERLTPTHAVKKGTRYRYYVSRSLYRRGSQGSLEQGGGSQPVISRAW